MMLREHQPDPLSRDERHGTSRLNLLLSYGGWRQSPVVEQLALLLEPLGISSFKAETGEQAADIIRRMAIHVAVVDLSIPLREGPRAAPAGDRLLQLLRRLDEPPPTVVVRPPQPAARDSARSLAEALRGGAFAVVDRPIRLETMLEVMRRVLSRHYAGHWPAQVARRSERNPSRIRRTRS